MLTFKLWTCLLFCNCIHSDLLHSVFNFHLRVCFVASCLNSHIHSCLHITVFLSCLVWCHLCSRIHRYLIEIVVIVDRFPGIMRSGIGGKIPWYWLDGIDIVSYFTMITVASRMNYSLLVLAWLLIAWCIVEGFRFYRTSNAEEDRKKVLDQSLINLWSIFITIFYSGNFWVLLVGYSIPSQQRSRLYGEGLPVSKILRPIAAHGFFCRLLNSQLSIICTGVVQFYC